MVMRMIVILLVVSALCLVGLAHSGEKEDFRVWQLQNKMAEIQKEWTDLIAKNPEMQEVKKRADALGVELQKAVEAKRVADGKEKKGGE
jgi:hypothetical protein